MDLARGNSALMLGCSLLSIISCVSVLFSFCIFPYLLRKSTKEGICYLIIANLISSFGSLVGEPVDHSRICWFEGIILNIFVLSSACWTANICRTIYSIVVLGFPSPIAISQHFCCWCLPCMMAFFPLINMTYGSVGFSECGLVSHSQSPTWSIIFWYWMSFDGMMWIVLITICTLVAMILNHVPKLDSELKYGFEKYLGKVKYYPAIIVLCWTIPLTCKLIFMFSGHHHDNKGVLLLPAYYIQPQSIVAILSVLLPCLQGFFTSMLFWMTNVDLLNYMVTFLMTGEIESPTSGRITGHSADHITLHNTSNLPSSQHNLPHNSNSISVSVSNKSKSRNVSVKSVSVGSNSSRHSQTQSQSQSQSQSFTPTNSSHRQPPSSSTPTHHHHRTQQRSSLASSSSSYSSFNTISPTRASQTAATTTTGAPLPGSHNHSLSLSLSSSSRSSGSFILSAASAVLTSAARRSLLRVLYPQGEGASGSGRDSARVAACDFDVNAVDGGESGSGSVSGAVRSTHSQSSCHASVHRQQPQSFAVNVVGSTHRGSSSAGGGGGVRGWFMSTGAAQGSHSHHHSRSQDRSCSYECSEHSEAAGGLGDNSDDDDDDDNEEILDDEDDDDDKGNKGHCYSAGCDEVYDEEVVVACARGGNRPLVFDELVRNYHTDDCEEDDFESNINNNNKICKSENEHGDTRGHSRGKGTPSPNKTQKGSSTSHSPQLSSSSSSSSSSHVVTCKAEVQSAWQGGSGGNTYHNSRSEAQFESTMTTISATTMMNMTTSTTTTPRTTQSISMSASLPSKSQVGKTDTQPQDTEYFAQLLATTNSTSHLTRPAASDARTALSNDRNYCEHGCGDDDIYNDMDGGDLDEAIIGRLDVILEHSSSSSSSGMYDMSRSRNVIAQSNVIASSSSTSFSYSSSYHHPTDHIRPTPKPFLA